jgi:medium-chain acyl-[acyl-carrier-protein] hydrolase
MALLTNHGGSSSRDRTWFLTPPDRAAKVRVFCFPFAGGSAAFYWRWRRAAAWLDICPVELPGRGFRSRERPEHRAAPLIEGVGRALAPELAGPYALFGHSMGALLCFELARWLRSAGLPPPAHIFASARRAPHLVDRQQPRARLPEPDLLKTIAGLGGIKEELLSNRDLLDLVIPRLRADLAVCEDYRYVAEAPLSVPLTVFGGADDPEAARAELEGWRAHTSGPVSVHIFPGDHFFIERGYELVLQAIERALLDWRAS